jgi:hypothetical protein
MKRKTMKAYEREIIADFEFILCVGVLLALVCLMF